MHGWKHESEFSSLMEEKEIFTRAPPVPQLANPNRDRLVVRHVSDRLHPLVQYLAGRDEELAKLSDLMRFVQGLYDYIPVDDAEIQFELLHPLRTWLFFLPIDFLRRGGEQRQDPCAMVLLAHYYGVALAVEPLFPAVGAAYFGTMSVGPIEQIHRTLARLATQPDAQRAMGMMEFPLEMVRYFRDRMDWKRNLTAGSPAPQRALHSSHLTGWDFDAFPEYAMVAGAALAGGHTNVVRAPVHMADVQDVHGSATDFITSANFIASAMQ